VQHIYEKELEELPRNGEYCSTKEVAMAANVLNCEIISHYPEVGTAHKDLNRRFIPEEADFSPAHIVWSYSDVNRHGSPNHFVCLLPMAEDDEREDVVTEVDLTEAKDE
jgi:hypothetical protein